MNSLNIRALRSSILGTIVMAVLLFVPAGTFNYWQAWVFMAVFVGASATITVYLAIKDPKLLERRMNVGPTVEKETTQKIIMSFAMIGFIALFVFPAFDHRFAWSPVPSYISLAGDGLVAFGFLFIFFVFKVNTYGASTIQIAEGQKVIDRSVRSRAPPNVRWGSRHAYRCTACTRLMVGTVHACPHYACAYMETP
jgi:hypothetical protein